jgi:phosphoribosylformimino-5-aminoimidazole carboxamide ribotide isomerase
MMIPSIDLMGGRVVQLEQGERVVIQSDDLNGVIHRFERFPVVQLVDLDAAKGTGDNDALVRAICQRLPCQVGGGVRSLGRARALLDAGAQRVIVGSSLFDEEGVRADRAKAYSEALGHEAFVAAIDGRDGHVVIHGWQTELSITPEAAATALDPFCGAFLYTNVETEGLLGGFPIDRARALQAATKRKLIVAGGIRSREEIDALDELGVDAVVGMAIYKGLIEI